MTGGSPEVLAMHAVARPTDSRRIARYLAAGAAAVVAVQYWLIGLGVLPIGTSASGETTDLLQFGLMAGATFAVASALLLLTRSRTVSIGVAVWSAIVIVAYVAFASVRAPQFEVWGLSVKAVQLVVLAAALYLVVRVPEGHA